MEYNNRQLFFIKHSFVTCDFKNVLINNILLFQTRDNENVAADIKNMSIFIHFAF